MMQLSLVSDELITKMPKTPEQQVRKHRIAYFRQGMKANRSLKAAVSLHPLPEVRNTVLTHLLLRGFRHFCYKFVGDEAKLHHFHLFLPIICPTIGEISFL